MKNLADEVEDEEKGVPPVVGVVFLWQACDPIMCNHGNKLEES